MANRDGIPRQSLRRSTRRSTGSAASRSAASGSEYQEGSDQSIEDQAYTSQQAVEEDEDIKPQSYVSRSGRNVRLVASMVESEDDEDGEADPDPDAPAAAELFASNNNVRRSSRRSNRVMDEEDEEVVELREGLRSRRRNSMDKFIASDEDGAPRYALRIRTKPKPEKKPTRQNGHTYYNPPRLNTAIGRASRAARRSQRAGPEEEDYAPGGTSPTDADGSFDEEAHPNGVGDEEEEDLQIEMDDDARRRSRSDSPSTKDGKPYAFRERRQVNYAIPPPLEDMRAPPRKPLARTGSKRGKALGWSASGAELGRWMGIDPPDSDSDDPSRNKRTPGKFAGAGLGALNGSGLVGAGGIGAGLGALDLAGTPNNLGKVGDNVLADADPLGVNVNVTFDEIGGLEDHIQQLKEMTLLPLLYPELFKQFNLTPPRGVLFHGPPGTGKTLMARALAASSRSGGRQITFFMRKGADCLSKWVGEAERQLRLLFTEAAASQPSIIFFDEIDGLAPVRSSKQDQIHASIVSTLLALMDGMDGRGQVVVIGATNRPDSVDPALRRPGRFDREFYFGLPSLSARKKILGIVLKGWEGWDPKKAKERIEKEGRASITGGEVDGTAPSHDQDAMITDAAADILNEENRERAREEEVEIDRRLEGLAKLTKGYGGADLRALCTEAALNAVQRKYPQIYKSQERLLIKPETVGVGMRDFMFSLKKIVPSSARSSSSAASPLPPQFVPLLSHVLDRVKEVIARILPVEKKLSALEDAEWEDPFEGEDDRGEGAFERVFEAQSIDKLRIYRPRMLIHGPVGMGQAYVGAATLHHLEGYHVQSLELATLMGDSTRTVEAAIVQLFVEAKRHQPSIIYIPSLVGWCAAVSEVSRTTIRAMLDTLAPTDPILLLAVVDGNFTDLPRDVREWFGHSKDNRITLSAVTADQREAFFASLINDVRKPPNKFADGMKRRKRVLEVLPLAPPIEPRQPTQAELALQAANDRRILSVLVFRLGPILQELKRKFKRFTKPARDEYDFAAEEFPAPPLTVLDVGIANGDHDPQVQGIAMQTSVDGHINGVIVVDDEPTAPPLPVPRLIDMDLERMHDHLYSNKYLTPQDFLDDVAKILYNAQLYERDLERLRKAQQMYNAAEVSINDFDPQFRLEAERMAVRERKRREEAEMKRLEQAKEKEKERAFHTPPPPGVRRSARHNGLEPELGITDPAKLERKLKRSRADGAGGESNGSDDENRDSKRSRISGDDDDERDPLNIGEHTPAQPPVQFNTTATSESQNSFMAPPTPYPDSHPTFSQPMVVDTAPPPARTDGFDPTLLNPALPQAGEENPFAAASPLNPNIAPVFHQTDNPFFGAHPHMFAPTPTLPERAFKSPAPERKPSPRLPTPTPVPVKARTPTPPLPDFHVDESLLSQLQGSLRMDTGSLTVEQLEQLRATCLGSVWRHRTEWDRDDLVRELQDLVQDFVAEVNTDDMGLEEVP